MPQRVRSGATTEAALPSSRSPFSWSSPTPSRPSVSTLFFRSGVLSLIRADRWTLPVDQVRRWLARVRAKDHQLFSVSGEPDAEGVLDVQIAGLNPVDRRPRTY